jgi:Fe(3+) dicitrate transport protein
MGTTSNLKEETWAFVPGGGLLYNHDENWQWFAGVYKGFNTAGPSASRDNGNPLQPEKSIAKEIGVRYGDNNLAMSVTGFHTDFKDVIVIDNSNAGGNPDNGGNVVSKGLELSTVYNPDNLLGVGDISFFANYTFTNANLDGDSTTTDTESIFAGGRDGSNVPYIPEHVLSFGADYEINKFDFGINMTYHSETYGTAEETETEESIGSANARAGRIDSAFLLNLRAGYKINDNYRVVTGVNNATDLQYISSRHPTGARAGAPLTAYIKAVASFDSIF